MSETGETPITQTPDSDTLGLTATEPEDCLYCFRLSRLGERYYLGKDDTMLCPNCYSSLLIGEDFDTIKATERVVVDYGGGLIRVRREGTAIIVAPGEVRHLVDALVEPTTRMADEQLVG